MNKRQELLKFNLQVKSNKRNKIRYKQTLKRNRLNQGKQDQ